MSKLVIVIDMQNDFIDGSLGSEAAQLIVPKAVAAIERYKTEEAKFITTHDWHDENSYAETLEGKLLPVPHCLVGTKGYDMHPAICEAFKGVYNYPETKKTFGYNWFREDLDRWNPEEIIIFGLCTDICVVSNALILRAAYPDIPIKCLAYCCAGTTPDAHEAALKVMESCQIEVIRKEGEY